MSGEIPTMYDETLSGILQNEGKITCFLRVIFGFLYRKTDFFLPLTVEGKTGFPKGVCEKLFRQTFCIFDKLAEEKRMKINPTLPKIKIIEVHDESVFQSPETGEIRSVPAIVSHHAEAPGNGAVHDKYSWNQTNIDVDVKVFVPKRVTKSKQLHVTLSKLGIKITVKGDQDPLIEGNFPKPVNSAESMWILMPGEYVQITLEKDSEGWWDSLLEGEGKIDLTRINAEVSFNDIGNEEQQTVRRLLLEQQTPS